MNKSMYQLFDNSKKNRLDTLNKEIDILTWIIDRHHEQRLGEWYRSLQNNSITSDEAMLSRYKKERYLLKENKLLNKQNEYKSMKVNKTRIFFKNMINKIIW